MNPDYNAPRGFRQIPIPERFGSLTVCETGTTRQEQHQSAHDLLRASLENLKFNFKSEESGLAYHPGGKPFFAKHPELYFNLSHCDGLAVCLISSRECGADVEMRRAVRPGILRKIFTSCERDAVQDSADPELTFTRIWTLKESYVKAIGKGIAFPMQEIFFTQSEPEICSNREHAEFYQVILPESGHIISLCILEDAPEL